MIDRPGRPLALLAGEARPVALSGDGRWVEGAQGKDPLVPWNAATGAVVLVLH